jgi:hypothetical protein
VEEAERLVRKGNGSDRVKPWLSSLRTSALQSPEKRKYRTPIRRRWASNLLTQELLFHTLEIIDLLLGRLKLNGERADAIHITFGDSLAHPDHAVSRLTKYVEETPVIIGA